MKARFFFFLILILVFMGGAMKRHFFSQPIPFAYDEPDYVANSMLLSKFNFGINTDSFIWSQRWAYDQPHLYHFISALFLESKYQQPIDTILKENELNQRYNYGDPMVIFGKIGHGKVLSHPEISTYKKAYEVVLVTRELSFYFYIVSGIVLISIIYFFCHPFLGALISLFYLNDYFYNTSVLAQADGLLILLILINILLSLAYIKAPKYRLILAMFMGVSCGLALSTKLNGGLTLISSILCMFLVYFSEPKRTKLVVLFHLPAIIFMTIIVFYWLNPYFYSNPVRNILNMFLYRIDMGSSHKLMFSNETLPAEPITKIVTIFSNLYQQTGQTMVFSFIFSLLSTIGSFLLLFLIFIKKVFANLSTLFLLISSTILFFIILVYVPMNWSRYYYPAIIQNLLMAGSIVAIVIKNRNYKKRKL